MSTLDTSGSSSSGDCGNRKCGDTAAVVVDEAQEVSSVVSRIMPREDNGAAVSWLPGETEAGLEREAWL